LDRVNVMLLAMLAAAGRAALAANTAPATGRAVRSNEETMLVRLLDLFGAGMGDERAKTKSKSLC
jgi:hypothetical protein